MKRYKSLKDLPGVKVGTMFGRATVESRSIDVMRRIGDNGMSLHPSFYVKDINNFDEWFEEVKGFEEWKPMSGDCYKCLGSSGHTTEFIHTSGSDVGEYAITTGNCYPLDTPDELIIKEQKLIPQAMHRLKMAAKKAWFEFNGSEGPDWSNDDQRKYYVYYNHSYRALFTGWTIGQQDIGQVYFPTSKSVNHVIDTMPGDLKLVLGVE